MKKINIILALDEKNGLGKDWYLAWRIKEDMKYFAKITTHTQFLTSKEGSFQNAVIMWRKTRDSIPEKFRPLPNRINCILSKKCKIEDNFWKIRKFSSFDKAIKKISQDKNIWEIFVIWWAQIYNLALQNPNLWKIYLTRVKWDFDCDVFVNLDLENFNLIENSEWKKNKKWIEFRFEVYERNWEESY